MRSKFITIYSCFFIAIAFALLASSCEGLDDWSDLQTSDLFDTKSGSDSDSFKRYTEPVMSSQPLVEYIVDDTEKYSRLYQKDIKKLCDYTKIPYHSMSIGTWNSFLKIAPSTRVFIVYDTKKLNDASVSKLIDFVSNGGTLFIPFANEDRRMAYLLGFKPEAEYATDVKSAGWYFSSPMLPGLKGKTYSTNLRLFGFASQNFSNKVKVLATSVTNANYPSVVLNTIGKGKVLLYNTSGEFIKADRGFLFAGILKGLEGIPYPIANTATFFLDDFPSPQYDIKAEPIQSEMNMVTSDFVQKVWWPDMKALAKEYKIPYAAMLTFDYRNKIVPPFTLDQWNSKKIKIKNRVVALPDWLVEEVAANGHELAFHGYNHVSLMKSDWKNLKFIETAINSVKKKWELSNYGKLPTTYVPPSNNIDKVGIQELKKAMPSIKYMCSLYLGATNEGGNREFDYDPYNKNLFDYPRILSGFYFDDDEKYNQQSMYLFTGIWTHFVHPDDVYQIPATANKSAGDYSLRNSKSYGWQKTKGKDKAMFPEFKSFVRQQTSNFPQMRFVNGNEGGRIVMDWRASRYTHKSENGLYTVKEINPDAAKKQYWFMYGSPQNADKIESQLKSQTVLFSKTPFMDGYLYSVYTNKPKLTVVDLNYKTPKERALQTSINELVKADLAAYNESTKRFQTGTIWVDDSDKKLKIEMAALKAKMLSSTVIDSVSWNKYAKYMSWTNNGSEVWKTYEEYEAKNASKENIMYAKELDRVIGYQNDIEKEKWMSAQILLNPYDKDLLNSYVANFYTDENQEKIKSALKALLKVDPSKNTYANYIKYLLRYNPDEARLELSDKKASEDLVELASPIVWLYADAGDYKKALEWAAFSKDIDFVTKMTWYIESGQSKALEPEYLKYIAEHPNDYKAKVLMSSVYHEMGRFKDSWVVANSLPEIPEKKELRKTLNKDVVYEETPLQQDLIANHSELFYPEVMQSLIKEYRLNKGDCIDLLSSLETNQANTAVQKNVMSYSFFDKKNQRHTISATYSKYNKLKLTEKYSSNYDDALTGVQYKFTTADRDGKPKYWSRARIELDKRLNAFYQFGFGVSASKNKTYKSAEFNVFPVETAPGVNQKMYQMQLNLYQDFYWLKNINTSVSFEGTYYTDGLIKRDTLRIEPPINPNRMARKEYHPIDDNTLEIVNFDNAMKGSLTVRTMYNRGELRTIKFIPFAEGQYSLASRNQAVGFPYWMIKNRLYGGGGVGWELGLSNFHSLLEAGYFFDDYSKHFERLTGGISYQLFDYTALTLNVEVFEQSKYYSNSVQLGIKYNLKKRIVKNKIIK